ncbi:unnamed protein product [Calypogeia fissa]
MVHLTSSLVRDVHPAHHFNQQALLNFLQDAIPDFPPRPVMKVKQFGHGQSNPTFLLEIVSDGTVTRYVVRKKPPGTLLPSAHAVDREFKILAALAKTDVPVPKVYCLCMDPSIIGTEFYVMEHVEGRIFLNPSIPEVDPQERTLIYKAMANALAAIHAVDVDAVGLSQYGRRENYCKRQVDRWARQYYAATKDGIPGIDPNILQLIDWLKAHVPEEDALTVRTGIVHGDFRLDNIIFHPTEPRVTAVLDWELSTLGNQMADIAYNSLPYEFNRQKLKLSVRGYCFDNGFLPGTPIMEEYLGQYCKAAGVPWPASTWKFYTALSLFRVIAIWIGVYKRMLQGNSSGLVDNTIAQNVEVMTNAVMNLIRSDAALPISPSLPGSVSSRENSDAETSGFQPSSKVQELREQVLDFMETFVYPNEGKFNQLAQSENRWTIHPLEEELKQKAKAAGLWNLWIPADSAQLASEVLFEDSYGSATRDTVKHLVGAGLSNLDYAHVCQIMGRSMWAPPLFNCGAPDTGNMEVLLRYGTPEQQKTWLKPLLEGEIRSGFAMTEPDVASSDATNIECSIVREGKEYVINGRKWWTSGAMDPRCRLLIVMGKTNTKAALHKQQSMVLVDIKTPGVSIIRPLNVFGFDDAPHGHAEVHFKDVRVPVTNMLLGEGRGFEIAQGRLGPGRLHHCMRSLGAADRAIELMAKRALQRRVFGKSIADQGGFKAELAECRLDIERTRLLVLHAANQLDLHGNKAARGVLAMAKVAAPRTALRVLDTAIQVHGGGGVSSDFPLAQMWAGLRTLRIADGPDEVHLGTIAKLELSRASRM